MVEKCLAKKNVMVFGYSDIGKSVVDMLQINGVGQIRVICDNNKEKQGGNYRNIPVKGIEGALGDLGSSYHIVITSQNYANEISRQLQLCGIRREDMSVYMNKNFPYYYKLDKKYLKVEIEEIFLKKYGTLDKYRKEIDKCLRMVRGDRQALLKFL